MQPPSGSNIFTVTLADVNNDGSLDAVAMLNTQGAYSYAVFFGDGKGGFTFNPNTVIPIANSFGVGPLYDYQYAITPTLGDFNGDGKLDLLVPTYDSATQYSLTDYLGNGDGTFTPGPVVYSGAGLGDIKYLVGDLNGDGKPDIVAISMVNYTPMANVYLGDGHGGFHLSDSVSLALANPNVLPVDLVLGDFSGNGNLDLAVSYSDFYANPTEVDIYPGDGAGHFAAPQVVTVGINPNNLVVIPHAPFLDAGTFDVQDQPPTAGSSTTTVAGGSSITIPVLDNAANPEGGPLTIVGVTSPAHGVAHIAGGPPNDPADEVIVYAPAPGYSGTDSLTYTIADAAGVESTGSVTVTVTPPAAPSTTSIEAVSGSGPYPGTATLTATLTVGSSPLPGKTVAFTLTEGGTATTVGTATTGANGVATLSGVSLAGLFAGIYAGAVGASFAGDATYAPSHTSGAWSWA